MQDKSAIAAALLSFAALLTACGGGTSGSGAGGAGGASTTSSGGAHGGSGPEVGSVRAFGFVAVACQFDDTLDDVAKSSYLDEVAGFTNLAHVCAFEPGQDLSADLDVLASQGSRGLIDVSNLLFESVPDPSMAAGYRHALRADAAARWSAFVTNNASHLDAAHVAALYPFEEPTWTGLTQDEMETATGLLKATHPSLPVLLVEAYPALGDLVVPTGVDWVGMDRYYVADPANDPTYLGDWEAIKAARSRPDQRLALILDSHYTVGHEAAGLSPDDMLGVAESYADLAAREPDVVAVIGYLWPGGLEGKQQLGARELPVTVRAYYESYGASVIAAP